MSQILHRSLSTALPRAIKAEGIYVHDADGRRYIDACGGAAVSCLGHGHPRLREALLEQLDRVAYMHTGFFTTETTEALATRLIQDAPAGFSHVMVLNGGSEAVEAALKMARQYHVERGEPQRRHIIARRQSYHGNTLGALATGGNMGRRQVHARLSLPA
jgi:adenosylmethionine-8-amino-7-oxononanoate aminotransferase